MNDDPEKIANASLHQRAEMMAEIERLRTVLRDIDRHAVVHRRVDPYDALQAIERMVQRALTGRDSNPT